MRRAGAACLLLSAALLPGCAGSLLKTRLPAVATYRLDCADCVPESAPGARIDADLAVLRPRVRAGLDSERIAVLYPDRRQDHYADAAWNGSLPVVLQDLLVEAFRRQGAFRSVDADAAPLAARYWLAIRVVDFQAEYAAEGPPVAHVHFVGEIGEAGAGAGRVIANLDAEVRRPAAANRLGEVVAAFDAATDAALHTLVARSVAAIRP